MGSKDSVKNTITSKFKDRLWEDKELEGKRKLRYYKEVINLTLDNYDYLSVLTNTKKKMNIARIRTNSHELRSETGRWPIPETPWDDGTCQLCDTKRVKDEKHFLLYFPTLTHIRSHFPNISHTSNLVHLLSHPNYSDLGVLISLLF